MKNTVQDLIQSYNKKLQDSFEETFHKSFHDIQIQGFFEGKTIYISKDNAYYYDYYNEEWFSKFYYYDYIKQEYFS